MRCIVTKIRLVLSLLDQLDHFVLVKIDRHLPIYNNVLFILSMSIKPFRWNHFSEQRRFLEILREKLNIRKTDDWLKVRRCDFTKYGGGPLLLRYSQFYSVLLVSDMVIPC